MRRSILFVVLLISTVAGAQAFENQYTRPLSEVINDVSKLFGVRLKCDVDTAGLTLKYADFRIRPYSLEETLANILSPFDFKAFKQNEKSYQIKAYEYPRRVPEEGVKLIAYLSSLYNDMESWEARKAILKREVRERLGIDSLLAQCSTEAPKYGKMRIYDCYMVQNFRLKTVGGHTVCGSIYAPTTWGKHPLIICPNGHFADGRYGVVQQLRLGTLARMGAVCVDYDLWGWGESEDEVGKSAHQTAEAHVMQALNGIKILDWMIKRNDVDTEKIGVNGGSGGGTQAVLLSVIDDRYTASCPVVSMSSWFDGGCPCESGMPIQLSGGGTCNPELAATFAPHPMMIVSDDGDWTATTPELEYPFIKRIYGFYGAEEKVSNMHLVGEVHDFGPNKRNAVYRFFINTFDLDASLLDEDRVTIEKVEDLRFTPYKGKE